ncbi:MAG: serine hydroxymethyltransferase [Christensenellales bacterium]|jgi:glycine hydroxymethyltransferase|nr:serine hydroxymethyltransferase [Clostridiales bacterium]
MWELPEVLKQDPAIYDAIKQECRRQEDHLELIASENFVSQAVMAAMGSPLTNKYAEGYPGNRHYGGCEYIDIAESLAIQRAKELFQAEHANVQPHSGSQANFAVYSTMLNYGDTVMGMNLNHGGHLTHGSPVNISGKYFNFVSYGLNAEDERIDYDKMEELALEVRPKMIVSGASAYSRTIDFERIYNICNKVGALMMVDMAHIAGLVATGEHPSPVPYADVVTSTTHKTLRGPRGGLILCKEKYSRRIDRSVFPGNQGGPLEHVIAAKAICFGEALTPEFKIYQQQVLKNIKAMENIFHSAGVRMVSGGTDNHLLLLDLVDRDITGLELETLLEKANITTNKNMVPHDNRKPNLTSGLRIGTPAITTRGLKEKECAQIADMIVRVINQKEQAVEDVLKEVKEITSRHPLYEAV